MSEEQRPDDSARSQLREMFQDAMGLAYTSSVRWSSTEEEPFAKLLREELLGIRDLADESVRIGAMDGSDLDGFAEEVEQYEFVPSVKWGDVRILHDALDERGREAVLRRFRLDLADQLRAMVKPDPQGPRITWRGTAGELADMFHHLVVAGWIQEPRRGRAALARDLVTMFQDVDGINFDLETLKKYMQPKGPRPVREGWRFQVDKRPEPEE